MKVVAVFDSPRAVERAIARCRDAGCHAVTVYLPAFDERLLDLVGATRSPVPLWALVGGAVGAACGFVLTIGTVRQWPGLVVSGKPLVSMPPFLIIVFELAILTAAVGASVAFLVESRRARRAVGAACGLNEADDRFALVVEAASATPELEAMLRAAGAIAWRAS